MQALMLANEIALCHEGIIIYSFKNQYCWLGTTKEALSSHQTLSSWEGGGLGMRLHKLLTKLSSNFWVHNRTLAQPWTKNVLSGYNNVWTQVRLSQGLSEVDRGFNFHINSTYVFLFCLSWPVGHEEHLSPLKRSNTDGIHTAPPETGDVWSRFFHCCRKFVLWNLSTHTILLREGEQRERRGRGGRRGWEGLFQHRDNSHYPHHFPFSTHPLTSSSPSPLTSPLLEFGGIRR